MFQFASPLFLWAFLGLLLPVAVHLLSKKPGRTVLFGSVQFLEPNESQQFSSLSFNRFWLWLLRVFAVAAAVLSLAGLQWASTHASPEKPKKWVLLSPGLAGTPNWASLSDSLEKSGFEKRWFATGFPLHGTAPPQGRQSYWTLIEALVAEGLDSAVVVASPVLRDFFGLQPEVPDWLTWLPVPEAQETKTMFAACLLPNGEVLLVLGNSGMEKAATETVILPLGGKLDVPGYPPLIWDNSGGGQSVGFASDKLLEVVPFPNPDITVHADSSYENAVKYFDAAFSAVQGFTGLPLATDTGPSLTVWLSDSAPPAHVVPVVWGRYGGNTFFQPFVALGNGRPLPVLPLPGISENRLWLSAELPASLLRLLYGHESGLWDQHDWAGLHLPHGMLASIADRKPERLGEGPMKQDVFSLKGVMLALCLFFMAAERLVAVRFFGGRQ